VARPQAGWLPGKVTDQYWFTIRQSVDERDLIRTHHCTASTISWSKNRPKMAVRGACRPG